MSLGTGETDSCNHDKRFSGVFDLPTDCHGCLACYAEYLASTLAIRDKEARDRLKEVERLEKLLENGERRLQK